MRKVAALHVKIRYLNVMSGRICRNTAGSHHSRMFGASGVLK